MRTKVAYTFLLFKHRAKHTNTTKMYSPLAVTDQSSPYLKFGTFHLNFVSFVYFIEFVENFEYDSNK